MLHADSKEFAQKPAAESHDKAEKAKMAMEKAWTRAAQFELRAAIVKAEVGLRAKAEDSEVKPDDGESGRSGWDPEWESWDYVKDQPKGSEFEGKVGYF